VAWGPIPATRMVIPVLLMAVLVLLGVAALRRQTAEEFADAPAAGTGTAALRAHASNALRTVSARRQTSTPTPAAAAAPAQAAARRDDHLGQLERLSALHNDGTLTDEEFVAEKALLLTANGSPS
jgi:hypothetical protein